MLDEMNEMNCLDPRCIKVHMSDASDGFDSQGRSTIICMDVTQDLVSDLPESLFLLRKRGS